VTKQRELIGAGAERCTSYTRVELPRADREEIVKAQPLVQWTGKRFAGRVDRSNAEKNAIVDYYWDGK
jgi:hypothetical protein